MVHIPSLYATNNEINDKNPNYSFIFDAYGGSYTSASCLISARSLCNRLDDKLINKQWEESFWFRWPHLLVNNLFNDLLMLWQHEVNGHGFRQRSSNNQISGYGLFPLWGSIVPSALIPMITPINGLAGVTYSELTFNTKLPSIDEVLLWNIGGNEANAVLANEMILKTFQQGKLDYRDYNLFFKAFTNLLGYLMITDPLQMDDDIAAYLKLINYKYSSAEISLTDLRWSAIVFFFNPILYKTVWSFYAYAFKNEKEIAIPCLAWNQITYMPLIRMVLTPFGVAYYTDHYVGYQNKTFLISLQIGSLPGYQKYFGGIGCKTDRLCQYKSYTVDLTAHWWHQPELLLQDTDTSKVKNHWGGMLGTHHQLQINDYLSLQGALLYKSAGFLEGVVASSGFIWQTGLSFKLPLRAGAQKVVA